MATLNKFFDCENLDAKTKHVSMLGRCQENWLNVSMSSMMNVNMSVT